MEWITQAIDVFLHLDRHLEGWAGWMGLWTYALLFVIVFCETGLVVTPFLPGDSLLFAVGALSARPEFGIDPVLVSIVLVSAAVLGDATNYAIGYRVGPKVFSRPKSLLFNTEHLHRAQRFYEKHGGKAIVLARFVPIIRTFAPFVAGIGKMRYRRFAGMNVGGALGWVISFVTLGYLFGNQPAVKKNFSYVILGIIIVSVIPIVVEFVRARRERGQGVAPAPGHAPSPSPPDSASAS